MAWRLCLGLDLVSLKEQILKCFYGMARGAVAIVLSRKEVLGLVAV